MESAQAGVAARQAVIAAAAAAAYYFLLRIGLEFAPAGAVLCPVWPLAGAALAAVSGLGPAAAFGIFLGAMLACWHGVPGLSTLAGPAALTASAALASGAALQAVAGAWFLGGTLARPDPLNCSRNAVRFALLAPVIALVEATCGAGALLATGLLPEEQFFAAWLGWWAGDTGGIVLAAPFFLAWSPRLTDEISAPMSPRRAGDALLGLAALAASVWAGFAPLGGGLRHPLTFLPFAALLWIALHRGSRAVTAGAAALAALVHWSTIRGYGPFALEPTVNAALLLGTAYCVVAAVTAYLLRAALAERRGEGERVEAARDALELRLAELDEDLYAANARLRDAAVARRSDARRVRRYRRVLAEAARRRRAGRREKEPVLL